MSQEPGASAGRGIHPRRLFGGAFVALLLYGLLWQCGSLLSGALRGWQDACFDRLFTQPIESLTDCSPPWYVLASAFAASFRLGPALLLAYWSPMAATVISSAVYAILGAICCRALHSRWAIAGIGFVFLILVLLGTCQALAMWLGGS